MTWIYHEPCCGSAAIALALMGSRRPLLPYQGSKWRFRDGLLKRFHKAGFRKQPAQIMLGDVGPWGEVAPRVLGDDREAILEHLRRMNALDPRELYDQLQQQPVSTDPNTYSAEFLFLQRLAYSGKAVGDRRGRWVSPGFNTSSAYGLAETERFGKVNPMIPSLISVLESYTELLPIPITGGRGPATPPSGPLRERTLVYLDPPYANSTRYPMGDLNRDGLIALAEAWRQAGAGVFISEGEPIKPLRALGWRASRLDAGRKDTSRFRGKQAEWLTWCPPAI